MAYQSLTLSALTARMQQRWDQSVFWTAEEARLAINEALRDWNLLTGRWRRRITLSTVAPVAGVPVVEYALPATLTYGMRVRKVAALHPTSILELDLARPTWRSETTSSGGAVPTTPTLWAPQSLQTIVIWPAVAIAGVDDLLVDGVAATPVLVTDGSFVDIGDEIVNILVDFAVHCAAFKEGGPRWLGTRPAYAAFLRAAAEENGLLKANQAFRRAAGLDRRRDLQKTHGIPNQVGDLLQAASSNGVGGGQ